MEQGRQCTSHKCLVLLTVTGLIGVIVHFALVWCSSYREFPIEAELGMVSSGWVKNVPVGNFAPDVEIPIVGYSEGGVNVFQFGCAIQRTNSDDRWGIWSQYGYALLGRILRTRKYGNQHCGECEMLAQRDLFRECFPVINYPQIHGFWEGLINVHDSEIGRRTQPRSLLQEEVGNSCVQRLSTLLVTQVDAVLSSFLRPIHRASHPVEIANGAPHLVSRLFPTPFHLTEGATHYTKLTAIYASDIKPKENRSRLKNHFPQWCLIGLAVCSFSASLYGWWHIRNQVRVGWGLCWWCSGVVLWVYTVNVWVSHMVTP